MFILNGIVFLIIGLALPEIVEGLHSKGIPLGTAIGYGVLVTGILIAARMISSYAAMLATFIFRRSIVSNSVSWKRILTFPLVLGWTGMRGVVSLAAALAIPVTLENGQEFPYRNLILFITFVVILLTLLIQGLTLPYIISRSHIFDSAATEEAESAAKQKMKQGLRQVVYEFLKKKYDNEYQGHAAFERVLKQWEERAKANDEDLMTEKTKALFVESLELQRAYLTELNKDPKINEEIIRDQLYQIDLEEERLKII